VSLAHSTVSGIIDRLEKRGFAERRVLETDRRVTRITASAPVREFLQKKEPELTLNPLLRALSRASEAERRAVRRGLNTLEKLLGEESGEACPPFSEGEHGTWAKLKLPSIRNLTRSQGDSSRCVAASVGVTRLLLRHRDTSLGPINDQFPLGEIPTVLFRAMCRMCRSQSSRPFRKDSATPWCFIPYSESQRTASPHSSWTRPRQTVIRVLRYFANVTVIGKSLKK
jgi:hypothetical protein